MGAFSNTFSQSFGSVQKGSLLNYWITRYSTGMSAIAISDTQVNLSWVNVGLTDYTGHKIYISTDGINYTLNKTVETVGTSTSVTGLTENTTYYFKIAPYKGNSMGSLSEFASDVTWVNAISDGDTWAWYSLDDLTKITKDDSNRVSGWSSRIGTARTLPQTTDSKKPIYDSNGIIFDGVDDFMHLGEYFPQPCMIYAIIKQKSWVANNVILAGASTSIPVYVLQSSSSPKIRGQASVLTAEVDGLTIDNFGIIKYKVDGSNSRLSVNDGTPETAIYDSRQIGGLSVGARSTGEYPTNIQVKEIIVRKVADTPENEAAFYNYLSKKLQKAPINSVQIPSVLKDSNTVAWFDAFDLSTLTKDESNVVTALNDKSGKGHHLSGLATFDIAKGIKFNGTSEYLKSGEFAFSQPESIYMVINRPSWTVGDILLDGNISNSGVVNSQYTTPQLLQQAGQNGGSFNDLFLNQQTILNIVFDGSNSYLRAFENNVEVNNPGLGNMNGITLARYGSSSSGYANIEIKEAIFRNKVDSEIERSAIYDYLKNKHFTFRGKALIIGDSISMKLDNFLRPLRKYEVTNIAYGGANIAGELSKYNALTDKDEYDYVFIMLGANHSTSTAEATISAYQGLVDAINSAKKVGCKIILSSITPMLSSTTWSGKDDLWHTLNEAILGAGATPITGVDSVIDNEDMGDANHYLLATYDNGDALHLNDTGSSFLAAKYAALIL